jgi:hypothetical protein
VHVALTDAANLNVLMLLRESTSLSHHYDLGIALL